MDDQRFNAELAQFTASRSVSEELLAMVHEILAAGRTFFLPFGMGKDEELLALGEAVQATVPQFSMELLETYLLRRSIPQAKIEVLPIKELHEISSRLFELVANTPDLAPEKAGNLYVTLLRYGPSGAAWWQAALKSLLHCAQMIASEETSTRFLRSVALNARPTSSEYTQAVAAFEAFVRRDRTALASNTFQAEKFARFLAQTTAIANSTPSGMFLNVRHSFQQEPYIATLCREIFRAWRREEYEQRQYARYFSLAQTGIADGDEYLAGETAADLVANFPIIIETDKALAEDSLRLLASRSMLDYSPPRASRPGLLRACFEDLFTLLNAQDPAAANRARSEGFVSDRAKYL